MSRFHIPGVKPEPGIRIYGDKVHLTYSALHDDELPFGYVLQSMRHLANQRWNGLMEYVIAREEHDEPADPTKAHHTGKTAFALAHFTHPLMIRRLEDLRFKSVYTDGIVFDDCDFSSLSAEDTIALLDFDQQRSLPARYSNIIIGAEIPMIFTTNKKPKKIFTRARHGAQREAIKRRYIKVKVRHPLMASGAPFTPAEKRARRDAGANGPQGPGVGP